MTTDLSLLLVDDDEDLRQYWGGVLAKVFRRVKSVSSAFEALNRLSAEAADVVLFDHATVDMNGLDFSRELRADPRFERTSVILYGGGYVSPRDKALASSLGAARFVSKPSSVDAIIRLIREVHSEAHEERLIGGVVSQHAKSGPGRDDSEHRGMGSEPVSRRLELLERTVRRYRVFAECFSDYVWETDASDRLGFTFGGANNVLDFPTEGAEGITPEEHWRDVFDDAALQRLGHLLQSREAFRCVLATKASRDNRVFTVAAQPFADAQGDFAGFRGAIADTTDAQKMSAQLRYEATHDALTGLKNARHFNLALETAIREDARHVLCYLDLDYFKTVNDTVGHGAGDVLLRELSELFQTKVRNNDLLARVGGDEFAILLRNCGLDQARRLVQDLHSSVSKYRFKWQGRSFEIGLSIGLVCLDQPSLGVKEVLSLADQACYQAKHSGRNQLVVYGERSAGDSKLGNEAQWLEKFHTAINRGGMRLLRQPILSISRRDHPHSYEVLVRIQDGDKLLSPDDFLPIIERYQLSNVLDEWVITTVLEWLNRPAQQSERYDYHSINISGVSLCKDEFRAFVYDLLQGYGALAKRICFEITETAAIENLPAAIKFIADMRSLGCRFSLDDFGTGFSSMAYLKNLSVDYLKIDGVFITGIATDPVDQGMLEAIQHLAGVLNIKTVAEYVETEEIADKLREVGVDCLQGYYVGYPEIIELGGGCK